MSRGDVEDLGVLGRNVAGVAMFGISVVVHQEASRLPFPVQILRDGDAEQLRPNLNEDQGLRE